MRAAAGSKRKRALKPRFMRSATYDLEIGPESFATQEMGAEIAEEAVCKPLPH